MKSLFILFFLMSSLFALNNKQTKIIKESYNIGKEIKARDGMTFGYALSAIVLQESSAGRDLIGDKYKNGKLKNFYDSSLGIFQIKLSTAKWIIRRESFLNKYFKNLLHNDKKLVNMLFTNEKFSALVAGYYLKHSYEEALLKNFKNPWFRSISRYNGGWNNTSYYHKIMKRLRYIKRLDTPPHK